MTDKLLPIIVAGALAVIATPAVAQTGVYGELRGGVVSASNVDITYYDVPGTFGGNGPANDTAALRARAGSALSYGGALGYDFGPVRTDLEFDYSRATINALTIASINGAGAPSAAQTAGVCGFLDFDSCSVSGNTLNISGPRIRRMSALANVWFDIPAGKTITPYVGGGLGVAGYEMDGEGKARFGWQIGAGAAVALSRKLALTIDFRHRQISGANFDDGSNGAYGMMIGKVKTNTFGAGLRFRF